MVNDGTHFECWLVHLIEKVDVGVFICYHVAVKEVYVCVHGFFSVFCDDTFDVLVDIFCDAPTFIWYDTIICYFVGEMFIYL